MKRLSDQAGEDGDMETTILEHVKNVPGPKLTMLLKEEGLSSADLHTSSAKAIVLYRVAWLRSPENCKGNALA